jgi:hypothetical protein
VPHCCDGAWAGRAGIHARGALELLMRMEHCRRYQQFAVMLCQSFSVRSHSLVSSFWAIALSPNVVARCRTRAFCACLQWLVTCTSCDAKCRALLRTCPPPPCLLTCTPPLQLFADQPIFLPHTLDVDVPLNCSAAAAVLRVCRLATSSR